MVSASDDKEPEKKEPEPAPRRTVRDRVRERWQSGAKNVQHSPSSGGMGSDVTAIATMATLAAAAGLVVLHPAAFSTLTNGAAKILQTLVRGK